MNRQAGLTLLEVLIAAALMALVGLIGAGLLSGVLTGRDSVEARLDRMEGLDRMRTLLRDDIGQIVARPARNEEGVPASLVFAGDKDGVDPWRGLTDRSERVILAFTRRGWANPGRARPRSSLQYVEYVLAGDQLVRRSWDYPDRAPQTRARSRVLVEGVDAVELDFLYGLTWRASAAALADQTGATALPRGVRLRYQLPGLGEIEHVVTTPGGAS
jgi:general secretion pathway protein J